MHKANLIGKGDLNPASCTGFLCDRAKAEGASKSCGCFFGKTNTNISAVVLEMNVKLVESFIPELVHQRSMQTTMLFIKDPESIGSLQHAAKVAHCRPLRQAIKKCVQYINDNGGFTIMGMITRGESQDVSNNREKVASENATWELIYLMPHIIDLENRMAYQHLKYKYAHIPSIEDNPEANSAETPD